MPIVSGVETEAEHEENKHKIKAKRKESKYAVTRWLAGGAVGLLAYLYLDRFITTPYVSTAEIVARASLIGLATIATIKYTIQTSMVKRSLGIKKHSIKKRAFGTENPKFLDKLGLLCGMGGIGSGVIGVITIMDEQPLLAPFVTGAVGIAAYVARRIAVKKHENEEEKGKSM